MIKEITIIGPGLIGSSLGLAIKKNRIAKKIIGIDKNKKNLFDALKNKSIDFGYQEIDNKINASDIFFLCSPVGDFENILLELEPYIKKGAIITDVGSVKNIFNNSISRRIKKIVDIVPGHPIAGTEFSGAKNAKKELFVNKWCILTPESKKKSTMIIKKLWENIGMKVSIMKADEHDKVMSMTSHLPHLIAFTIVGSALNYSPKKKKQLLNFSAGGFKDFTRIASSDPKMWKDIFISNRKNIIQTVDVFINNLNSFKSLIENENTLKIMEFIKESKKIRKDIVKLE